MEENVTKFTQIKGSEEYITLVYPGGPAMMYGGTRKFNPAFHLNRWWQYNTRIEEGRKHFPCQLHSTPQKVVVPRLDVGEGFTLIRNSNTPYFGHTMYIPAHGCWPEDKIRTMGGLGNIHGILEHAMFMMKEEHQQYSRLICYVGAMMGMNQMDFHLHHLAEPDNSNPDFPLEARFDLEQELALKNFWRSKSNLAFEVGSVRIVCDSIFRAGQTFLVSNGRVTSYALAKAVNLILKVFAAAFTSDQGLAPDFMLILEFRNGEFDWGYYSPYLHHIGYEQGTGFRNGVYTHPWGPEQTLKRLLEASAQAR